MVSKVGKISQWIDLFFIFGGIFSDSILIPGLEIIWWINITVTQIPNWKVIFITFCASFML